MQIPLKLSFSMTVHKSQGMTLNFVEIDCSNIFAAGQLAVAIGRARNTAGLAVFNFNEKKHVIQPSSDVTDFMHQNSMPPNSKDNDCCKLKYENCKVQSISEQTLHDGDELDTAVDDQEIVNILVELLEDQLPDPVSDEDNEDDAGSSAPTENNVEERFHCRLL